MELEGGIAGDLAGDGGFLQLAGSLDWSEVGTTWRITTLPSGMVSSTPYWISMPILLKIGSPRVFMGSSETLPLLVTPN
jgi:hypothetical protein